VHTGRFEQEHLVSADEVFVMSTVKEVTPVVAVGEHSFAAGPVTHRLRAGFVDLVRSESE